jgi:hypothetical protein
MLPPPTQKMFPLVMSLVKEDAYAYMAGFKNPTEPFPNAILAALMLEMKPATAGQDADVPDTGDNSPPM